MRRKITVTEQHLIDGQTGAFCPIELAAQAQGIRISIGTLTYKIEGRAIALSKRMRDFVHAYDNSHNHPMPKPTSFYLEV